MAFDWVFPILAGALRNVVGFLDNVATSTTTKYEWGKLASTVLQVTLIGFAAHYGLSLSFLESSGVALLSHFGLTAVKKAGTN